MIDCRAFALEGTGIWHAATVSLAQQLWGPLRMRLDSRLALDTTAQVIAKLSVHISCPFARERVGAVGSEPHCFKSR